MTKDEKEKLRPGGSWIDIVEAADHIRHSVQYIYNNKEAIPHEKPGGKMLFRPEQLDAWVCRNWDELNELRGDTRFDPRSNPL